MNSRRKHVEGDEPKQFIFYHSPESRADTIQIMDLERPAQEYFGRFGYKCHIYCRSLQYKTQAGDRTWQIHFIRTDAVDIFLEEAKRGQLDVVAHSFINCFDWYRTVEARSNLREGSTISIRQLVERVFPFMDPSTIYLWMKRGVFKPSEVGLGRGGCKLDLADCVTAGVLHSLFSLGVTFHGLPARDVVRKRSK